MILLVEDNETIARALQYSFQKNNLTLEYRNTLREAKKYIEESSFQLIILDVTLPDGNGFDFFHDVLEPKNIPTIFLTAKEEEDDIVKGLQMGAEDYVTKPFSTKELLARVQKILLRNEKNSILKVGDISFDMDKMMVYKGDNEIELTSLELKLLHLLFLNANKVVRRTTILDKIWEWTGNDVDDHTVTVYFKRIREKLKTDIIVTVKGIGYRVDVSK